MEVENGVLKAMPKLTLMYHLPLAFSMTWCQTIVTPSQCEGVTIVLQHALEIFKNNYSILLDLLDIYNI